MHYVYVQYDSKKCRKIISMLLCSIITHVLEIFEIFKSLLWIIQTYISNLQYNNSNNNIKWSDGSTNWHDNIIWVHKLVIKFQMISVTTEHTLFRNGYESNIVSWNVTWTLKCIILFKNFWIICTTNLTISLCLVYYCKIQSYISNVCAKQMIFLIGIWEELDRSI
jgi:hypothetical protein